MDNYQLALDRARACFLGYDQGRMIERFRLRHDAESIYIRFISREYRIDRRDGSIESESGAARFDEGMTIFDVLSRADRDLSLSGSFVGIGSAKGLVTAASPGGEFFARQAAALDARADDLPAALTRLGGAPDPIGDISARLPLFDFMDVILRFYRADEDFPADARIFWDENVLSYMYFETTFYTASFLFRRILEEMGECGCRRR